MMALKVLSAVVAVGLLTLVVAWTVQAREGSNEVTMADETVLTGGGWGRLDAVSQRFYLRGVLHAWRTLLTAKESGSVDKDSLPKLSKILSCVDLIRWTKIDQILREYIDLYSPLNRTLSPFERFVLLNPDGLGAPMPVLIWDALDHFCSPLPPPR